MKYTRLFKSVFVMAILLLLSACSFLSPAQTPPASTYLLNSIPLHAPNARTHPVTILVAVPETKPAFDTKKMAYSIKPYQLSYFSENEWAETPAEMLQPLIVQTLQNTHYYHAVVTPPFLGTYTYALNTQIISLWTDFTEHPSKLRFVVRAQLSRGVSNQVIATRVFVIEEPLLRITPYDSVIAANRASVKLLDQLAAFCLHKK